MFKQKLHVALTAAALLALAACGSGSDSSNDAGTAAKSLANGGAAQSSLATKADTPAEQAGAAAAAQIENPTVLAQAAETATPVAAVAETAGGAPITGAGVRGDALLSMLDQYSCSILTQATGPNGTPLNDGYPPVGTYNIFNEPTGTGSGVPSDYKQVPGTFSPAPSAICDSKYYTYGAITPGTYTLRDYEGFGQVAPFRIDQTFARKFNGWQGKVAVTVTNDGFSMAADAKGDSNNQELNLNSTAPFNTRFSDRIPYGVLSVWKDAQGHNYQLMLWKGDTDSEARLCWNVNTDAVKRLSCSTWSAPQNWKRGDMMTKGLLYVIDDRTAYGGQGLVYFNNKSQQ